MIILYLHFCIQYWGLGIGDWGLGIGIGDWGLGPIPNPQSPIPNPQSPIPNPHTIQFISLVSLHTYFIKISVIPINNKKEINNKRPKESNININKIVYRYN